ncbi:amino acid permease [Bryobacter aggregatus]|uniref:amino acid permease n=1 Tax=Bryobacter aggregatus TaxID=360054 RepID=UPI0004E0B77C|nr:amino acid permease [Bryobacter aggregatus]
MSSSPLGGSSANPGSSSAGHASTTTKVVVATTVALSFISFWRGAAIVLSDMASTMFYIGGITEQAIGKTAPWFILAVMLYSFAVRSVYMESCSMFVRGGVYVVVRDAMGPMMAKISVSALIVDYILTGPISSVSAGQYLGHLINETLAKLHQPYHIDPATFAASFGVAVTLYFWYSNLKGIHESSQKALRIMQITTVMVVLLLGWSAYTLIVRGGAPLPPSPTLENLRFTPESLGWFEGTFWPSIAGVGLLIAFGHSLLAMSGFETLAQVYREIAYPKMKNLKITGNIVCFYAVMSTGLISMLAVMIIPDSVRPRYYDNLIGGMVESLDGNALLKYGFHLFVVIVGTLILSGAVNTSIIGANGVLNRVAEDGVLLKWFRKPHAKYGTSARIIHLITILQLLTILGSRGDVYLLGEAYAFGVVWSFFMKALGVLALRFQRHDQEYKFPFNFHIAGREIPFGLATMTFSLLLIAIANLVSKKVATVYGITFTIVLFILFSVSEYVNRQKQKRKEKGLEQFNLEHQVEVTADCLEARPGCVLVAVRGWKQMGHLRKVLEKTNLRRHDIVVMTVRPVAVGTGEHDLADEQLFTSYEQELFSHVVQVAEKEGKPVDLLVVPAVDPFDAMVQTANKLKASRLVSGVSPKMASEELARRIGLAWEKLDEPRHPFSLEIIAEGRSSVFVNLGPHPPRLWPEDLDLLHEIWLKLSGDEQFGSRLHHRDVVGLALSRLEKDLNSADRDEIVGQLAKELRKS